MTEAEETLQRLLDQALTDGASAAEAFLLRSKGITINIEGSEIAGLQGGEELGVGLRVLKNDRLGFAYAASLSKPEKLVKEAISISNLSDPTPFRFAEPVATPSVEGLLDRGVRDLTTEVAADHAAEMISSAQDINPKVTITRGSFAAGEEWQSISNTSGVFLDSYGTYVDAWISVVLEDRETSTGFEVTSSRKLDLDFSSVGRNAAELAERSQHQEDLKDGCETVVLTPYAVAGLFEHIIAPALYGDAYHRGESVYASKLGKNVAHDSLTLADDGSYPGGLNSAPTDDEGVPSRRVELIKEGRLDSLLFDQRDASKYEVLSTGNGMRCERLSMSRSYKAQPRTTARNLILEGDTLPRDVLIQDVKQGLLIYEVLGAHTANPASGEFSVNMALAFHIEQGEISSAVRHGMLSGNLPEALNHLEGIGNDPKILGGGLSPLSFVVPSIALSGLTISR